MKIRVSPSLPIIVILGLSSIAAQAAEPKVQTPSPVIHLAENLDEQGNLGWCIDTLGRGFAEELQVHSCKPRGGDVQFSFDEASGQIRSAEYNGKCAELSAPNNKSVPFGLLDCEANNPAQKFTYDATTGQFRPLSDNAMCIAAAPESRSAGPFMSRDLILSPCAETDPLLTNWVIK